MIEDPQLPGKVEARRGSKFDYLVRQDWLEALDTFLQRSGPEQWTDWEPVKESTVRRVLRGQLIDPATGQPCGVHLKLFRPGKLFDRARESWRGSRGAREFHNLDRAARRGIPCVEALAAGSLLGTGHSQSFLLTRTAPGTPLPRAADGDPWITRPQAEAAGALLRQIHDAGIYAHDLHPGNLLWDAATGLRLLDLTSVSFCESLEVAERARGLAYFCLDRGANFKDPAARPLVHAYGMSPLLREKTLQQALRLRHQALSSFGRRAERSCAHTLVEKQPRRPRQFRARAAESLWPAAERLLAQLDQLEPHKSGRRGAVYLEGELCCKTRSAAAARRLWTASYWLQFCGVESPEAVLLRTHIKQGQVVTRRLPRPNLREELQQDPQPPWAPAAARWLGTDLARLHSAGLRNRDLKFENLIRDPATQRCAFVDLDGVQRQRPSDGRRRAADLGRLLAAFVAAGSPGGHEVQTAFLRAYVGECRRLNRPVPHRRHTLREAIRRADAWASRHPDF